MGSGIVNFTPRDLMRGKPVPQPAWYRIKVDDQVDKPTTTEKGPSVNHVMQATILRGADESIPDAVDMPIEWNFNSKAIGFAKGFFEALGVELKAGVDYSLGASKGMELEMFIGHKEYQGRIVNDYSHQYRPVAEKRNQG